MKLKIRKIISIYLCVTIVILVSAVSLGVYFVNKSFSVVFESLYTTRNEAVNSNNTINSQNSDAIANEAQVNNIINDIQKVKENNKNPEPSSIPSQSNDVKSDKKPKTTQIPSDVTEKKSDTKPEAQNKDDYIVNKEDTKQMESKVSFADKLSVLAICAEGLDPSQYSKIASMLSNGITKEELAEAYSILHSSLTVEQKRKLLSYYEKYISLL